MGVCYRKSYEQGAWFEIQCTADTIRGKESRGEDASFERGLLKSWKNYPGYKDAGRVLSTLGHS